MTDAEFLAAFEACTIPRADWTHEAHVRMAWLYLTGHPFPDALQRIRTGIRRYNDSLGGTGYHDTITVAFARLIASRLAGDGYAAFRAANPDLMDRTIGALKRYYSEARLKSDEAKAAFVEPDLTPLPTRLGS
jgi:hypothetical protein